MKYVEYSNGTTIIVPEVFYVCEFQFLPQKFTIQIRGFCFISIFKTFYI